MPTTYSTLRFAQVSASEAASGYNRTAKTGSGLSAQQRASEIVHSNLVLDEAQRAAVDALYASGEIKESIFTAHGEGTQDSQRDAVAMMASLHLDACDEPGSKWRLRREQLSSKNESNSQTKRTLYQCACGYDHTVAKSKSRHVPLPFTGCLAHVEVTVLVATQQILRIRGYFDHNDECKTAHFTRIPPVPVHPSVYSLALKHLAAGATLADVHKQNRAMFQSYGYAEMPRDSALWKHRWLLLPKDTRSLYRQFSRWKGVRTTEKAHINVDEWLDPASPRFNKTLADAVFHYSARASKDERFEACIATKDMKQAAWKYCHQSQIMVDGTFGICEKKVLLFVVMGIDEDGHGIPVAFLLFSAPTGNNQTSSGYDTAILAKLLQKWK